MGNNPDYKFIFFNVGQGDATLLCYMITRKCILVDAYKSEPILEELVKSGIQLNAILISHWDEDHIKGLVSILDNQIKLKSKTILGVNRQVKDTKVAKIFSQKIDEAIENGIIERNDTIPLFNQHVPLPIIEGFNLSILWPPNHQTLRDADVNKDSVILKIAIKENNILLLPGDASGDCWNKVEPDKLKVDIFKYPHHGGSIGRITARELIEKINPKFIVVSYGESNRHGHPCEDYQIAKEELSDKIKFFDTTKENVTIYYDSLKNNIFTLEQS